MNIENLSDEELKELLRTSKQENKKPVSIDKGIYATIRGSVDDDNLLIEPTENELEEAYLGVIEYIRRRLPIGAIYKIFCFLHLNSKQGPRVPVPAIMIYIEDPFYIFLSRYKEKLYALENKYIGGEEYNEQILILSRVVNIQFHYQIWEKK